MVAVLCVRNRTSGDIALRVRYLCAQEPLCARVVPRAAPRLTLTSATMSRIHYLENGSGQWLSLAECPRIRRSP